MVIIGQAEASQPLSVEFSEFLLYLFIYLFIRFIYIYIFQAVRHACAVNAQHVNVGPAG